MTGGATRLRGRSRSAKAKARPPGSRTRFTLREARRRLICLAWGVAFVSVFAAARIARPWVLRAAATSRPGVKTVCPFRAVSGRPCALCGLTRAFSHAAGGEFGLAFERHLLWPAAAVLVAAAAVTFLADATTGSDSARVWGRLWSRFGWFAAAALAFFTVVRALLSA